MKPAATLLVLAAALQANAQTAKTPAKPAVHSASSSTATHVPPCAKLPELSPKIPALPPGLPCARPLYTITTTPNAKLDYASPMEGPELRTFLGIEPVTFSLDYIDTKVGTGPLALPHKWYTIHYTGYLVDGTKFDSSLDRKEPIYIPYGERKVIPGWDTGFGGMHIGGKRRLFIPYELAYGSAGKGPIPPKAELIFDVELLAQSDTDPTPKAPPAPPMPPRPAPPSATPPAGAPSTPPPASSTPPPAATPPATAPKP